MTPAGRSLNVHYEPANESQRWLAYFDLLGVRDLLRRGCELEVFCAYQQAIEELGWRSPDHISYTWFSDTFLIASADSSAEAFTWVEQIARWFAYFLLNARIPLRGAIACDTMYADFNHHVFFGKALIEAYEYGEGQDWVGLVLCPSARSKMKTFDLSLPRLHWALWEPQWKRKPKGSPPEIGACILGSWCSMNGENSCLMRLREMAEQHQGNEMIRIKYDRAIQFIQDNPRRLIGHD